VGLFSSNGWTLAGELSIYDTLLRLGKKALPAHPLRSAPPQMLRDSTKSKSTIWFVAPVLAINICSLLETPAKQLEILAGT